MKNEIKKIDKRVNIKETIIINQNLDKPKKNNNINKNVNSLYGNGKMNLPESINSLVENKVEKKENLKEIKKKEALHSLIKNIKISGKIKISADKISSLSKKMVKFSKFKYQFFF